MHALMQAMTTINLPGHLIKLDQVAVDMLPGDP
jgi:hypothetical protein